MHKNKTFWQRPLARLTVCAALGVASTAAHADRFGVQIAGGMSDRDINKVDLGLVWDPDLTWWEIGGFHFTLVGEGHVSYWHSTMPYTTNPDIWEFGVTPMVRFVKSSGYFRPFIEAGVGVRLLTHARFSPFFTASTAFQFADVVGIGVIFGQKQSYQAGFRYQHVSNAGIKEPNPGINFSQLYLQYNF
ncbi:acyloxyacyl hydrolase [Caballeronia cordobensis]|uniref:acyloxyacyl hydrolase n=1 Tax=Caballeronia cordobensis TaxID=1353886 RepID=UPI00045F0EFC|nr:lipid A deacylase [Burkholderia sp. RPE67]